MSKYFEEISKRPIKEDAIILAKLLQQSDVQNIILQQEMRAQR